MFRYFKVLRIIPDAMLRVGRKGPDLLRFEGWIAKVATVLKYSAVIPAVTALVCTVADWAWAPVDLPLALLVWSVAMFMIAYVLCIWLIYRLSQRASKAEYEWCMSTHTSMDMVEPYPGMNRYVLATYEARYLEARLAVISGMEQGWLSRLRTKINVTFLFKVVYSNLAVTALSFMLLPYLKATWQVDALMWVVLGYTALALPVVLGGAFLLVFRKNG